MNVSTMKMEPTRPNKRITIIPCLHGKLTRDGKLSEPDIYYILEKWLDRHPEMKDRTQEFRISRFQHELPEGIPTEIIRVTMTFCDEFTSYDPVKDRDLYEYFLADEGEYQ